MKKQILIVVFLTVISHISFGEMVFLGEKRLGNNRINSTYLLSFYDTQTKKNVYVLKDGYNGSFVVLNPEQQIVILKQKENEQPSTDKEDNR